MQSLRLLPNEGAVVPPALTVEAERDVCGLAIGSAVVLLPKDGITQMVVKNNTGFIQKLDEGTVLGVVENAEVLEISAGVGAACSAGVN